MNDERAKELGPRDAVPLVALGCGVLAAVSLAGCIALVFFVAANHLGPDETRGWLVLAYRVAQVSCPLALVLGLVGTPRMLSKRSRRYDWGAAVGLVLGVVVGAALAVLWLLGEVFHGYSGGV